MRELSSVIMFLIICLSGVSQTTEPLISISLEDALASVATNNLQAKQSLADVRIAEKTYQLTKSAYLPQINFSIGGIMTNDPLQTFGLKLKKKDVIAEDFAPDLLNDPDPIGNVFGRIEAHQSILQMSHGYKKKAIQEQISAGRLKSNRIIQAGEYQVKNTFYQLQSLYNNEEALLKAKEVVNAHIKIAGNLFTQGLILNLDILKLENRLLELDFQTAELWNQITELSDYLCYLTLCDQKGIFQPAGDPPLNFSFPDNENFVIAERADLSALKAIVKSNEMMREASKKEFIPKIYGFGAYELNDYFSAQNFMLGIQVNWNIYDGGFRNANQEKMQAEVLKLQLDQDQIVAKDELEIQKAIRSMKLSESQFILLEKQIKLTEQILKTTQNRFEQGLAKTTDLLEVEAELTNQNLALLQSRYQFLFSKLHLEFLLDKTFD